MSQISFESVIGRIFLDSHFRDALLSNPDQTLAEFALTKDEKAELKCLDCETMEFLAETLAVRLAQIRRASSNNSLIYNL